MLAGLRRPQSWVILVVSFSLFWLLSAAWAAATPIFGAPDENAHAVKAIATVRGDFLGHQSADSRFPLFDLPSGYSYSDRIVCFAYKEKASASCGAELGDAGGVSTFPSWVSTYNPVYYLAVGWPSLFLNGSGGIYAMRLVSAAICSLLLAATTVIAFRARRAAWMGLGVAFGASPMIIFLNGVINPQAMEVAAGALLLVGLLRLIESLNAPDSVGISRRWLWTAVVAGASLMCLARATGPLWVVLLVAGACLASGLGRSRQLFASPKHYPAIGAIALVGLFSILWTLFTGTLSGQADASDASLVGGTFFEGLIAMVRLTPGYLQEAEGVFGWLDTPLPTFVYALYAGAVAVLLTLALVVATRRDRVVVALAVGVAIAVPVFVQSASVARTGIIWQGRYGLYLYLCVLLLAAWVLSRSEPWTERLTRGVTAVIVTLLAVYQVAAYFVVLHRYVVGGSGTLGAMIEHPDWQPPGGWVLLTVLLVVVAAAFAVWVWTLSTSPTFVDADRSSRQASGV